MLSTIGNLVQTLVVIVILTAVLDMLLPQQKFRQYLRLVVGLLVLLMVVNVFAGILGREGTYASFMLPEEEVVSSLASQDDLDQHEEVWEENREAIVEEYRQRLHQYLQEVLEAEGWEKKELHISVQEDDESPDFGRIEKVQAKVAPLEEKDTATMDQVEVPSVTVGEKDDALLENQEVEEDRSEESSSYLEDFLSTRLGIAADKVIVRKRE